MGLAASEFGVVLVVGLRYPDNARRGCAGGDDDVGRAHYTSVPLA